MSLLVIGINHHSPLSVLERVTVAADEVAKAVDQLARRDSMREVVVLSTCNRTEVYAVAERFHGAFADIRDYLCTRADLAPDDLHPHLYAHHDEAAVAHLFEVAAGIDSVVVGESEILGQVRRAWEVARAEGAARTTLNLLFRHAVEAGKRVRNETAIGRGTASISHAAVEMADERLPGLAGRRVAVVGAGEMGEGIATALRRCGASHVAVVNRSTARGEALAGRVEGTAFEIDQLGAVLADTDVAITCTGSGSPIVTTELLGAALADRRHRPLLLVDIAMPRDVASDVAELAGVEVLDLDHLNRWAERGRASRLGEVDRVRAIVAEETERFAAAATALQAAPLVTALRQRAEAVRVGELARHATDLASFDDEQRAIVEGLTAGIVAKLLHEPSVRLRDQAGTPRGERNAAAVADLFDLG